MIIIANTVYLSLGSNLGDKEANLNTALKKLAGHSKIKLQRIAPLYKTAPVGYLKQDWFYNTAAEISTTLSPFELLAVLQDIENQFGRVRTIPWGPRVIDLDIIWYEKVNLHTSKLVIPHPRLTKRAFVLVPLAVLTPALIIPGKGKIADLAKLISQEQEVKLKDY
ncbi:MAG TPA: 2-amino-4-hydroxy-6-hydroxymethyldihydropteridine diphosphokinase [Desulfotomaculum sp.]|nr:2-amino-4-hydroxy-6-hydroxymethyldihydropteridine diphosphokinase [Desulfotomaculum sp.]